jgi:hypothetical protein
LGVIGAGKFECFVCLRKNLKSAERYGANCCDDCWDMMWESWTCHTCKLSLKQCRMRHLLRKKMGDEDAGWTFRVQCRTCQEENELEIKRGTPEWKVLQAVRGIKVVP